MNLMVRKECVNVKHTCIDKVTMLADTSIMIEVHATKGEQCRCGICGKSVQMKMLILYEVMNFGLTYFHMTGNMILKTGNLSVCQAAK